MMMCDHTFAKASSCIRKPPLVSMEECRRLMNATTRTEYDDVERIRRCKQMYPYLRKK